VDQVTIEPEVMVIVFPAPAVEVPEEPNTFKMLSAGIAVPESVTKLVGMVGVLAVTLVIPA
jgi:predicted membrane protein